METNLNTTQCLDCRGFPFLERDSPFLEMTYFSLRCKAGFIQATIILKTSSRPSRNFSVTVDTSDREQTLRYFRFCIRPWVNLGWPWTSKTLRSSNSADLSLPKSNFLDFEHLMLCRLWSLLDFITNVSIDISKTPLNCLRDYSIAEQQQRSISARLPENPATYVIELLESALSSIADLFSAIHVTGSHK